LHVLDADWPALSQSDVAVYFGTGTRLNVLNRELCLVIADALARGTNEIAATSHFETMPQNIQHAMIKHCSGKCMKLCNAQLSVFKKRRNSLQRLLIALIFQHDEGQMEISTSSELLFPR